MTETPEGFIDVTPVLRRRIAWDVLPCDMVPELMSKVGLVNGTEDGDELEHRDSHARLNELLPIEGILRVTISLAGDIIARAILETNGISNPSQGDPQYDQYIRAINAGVIGVLANLVDMGAVRVDDNPRIML